MSETNEASVQSVVHTPGPWKLDTWNGWLLSAEDVGIIKFDINRTLFADAKLIAAAPDMLKTLRACVAWFKDNDLDPCVLDDVKDAIKKAIGDQV